MTDRYATPEFRESVRAHMTSRVVRESVALAPPFTDAQRVRLAGLFSSGSAPSGPKEPEPKVRNASVYAIGAPGEHPHVKIGTTVNVARRLGELNATSPIHLRVLWTTSGGRELERALHKHFADRRCHGEWFDFTGVEATSVLQGAVDALTAPRPAPSTPAQAEVIAYAEEKLSEVTASGKLAYQYYWQEMLKTLNTITLEPDALRRLEAHFQADDLPHGPICGRPEYIMYEYLEEDDTEKAEYWAGIAELDPKDLPGRYPPPEYEEIEARRKPKGTR